MKRTCLQKKTTSPVISGNTDEMPMYIGTCEFHPVETLIKEETFDPNEFKQVKSSAWMKKGIISGIAVLLFFQLANAQTTETRQLSPFREVSLRVSANLTVEQGNQSQIEMTADQETLDKIIVEVIDHKLIIRFSIEDMWFSSFNPGKVTLKIITPEIESLGVAGSGNILAEKPINTRVIELDIAGSGDIKIANLTCERMEADIAGSGDIIVSGEKTIHEIELKIAGSGNLKANQLKAEYGKFWIAGSGNCDVSITDLIEAKILGSGDIRYEGSPSINSSVSGSGKIHKIK
ncbi:MAG TPA: head GIN domain-containing protein [Prolixibacteraceae bacterium]|nr:head GIN domain-containing protein [Prolixibacteraceae bacterium]HPS12086.1 head GIN domain-containing protein [Prolixibacteraceae bacterium]